MNRHGQEYYARGLAWIADHRGGHNGNWPPTSVGQCIGWGCIRQLAYIHNISATAVAADVVDYLERREKGDPQP